MKLIEVKCPSCGGFLTIDENKRLCTCPYCNRQVLYDDGIVRIVYTDTARIRELELLEQERQRQEEQKRLAREKAELEAQLFKKKRKRWWLFVVIWAILVIAFIVSFAFIDTTDNDIMENYMIRWSSLFSLGWFILPSVYPKSAEEKQHRFKTWLKMFGIVYLSVLVLGVLLALFLRLIVPSGLSNIR